MINTIFTVTASALAALFLVATILPFAPSHAWWVRAWDFPRVQILIYGIVVLGVLVFIAPSWKWALMAAVAVGCLYQAVRIFPYTPLKSVEMGLVAVDDDSGSQVVVMSSNIEMINDRYDAVTNLIEEVEADILFLMETNETWFNELASALESYDTIVSELKDNYYGMVFATRLKVHNAEVVYLTPDETPTLFAELETRAGQRFRFVGVHPRPPVPGNNTEDRDAQIIYTARFARERDMPVIAMGDFNDAAWSDTSRRFKHVGGYLDPRVGRGMIASFDVKSRLMRTPIDQFYSTADIAVAEFRRGPDIGSDHFPMISRIDLDPEVAKRANTPPPPLPEDELAELDRIVADYRDQIDSRHIGSRD